MTRKSTNPTNPLLSQVARFEQGETSDRQWESGRVEWLLRRLKLNKERLELLADSSTALYSFAEFNRVVPFPVWLGSDRLKGHLPIHKDPRSIHPLWFKSFTSLPFMRAFEARFDELSAASNGKPIGMVFPRKGFQQGLIVHTGSYEHFVMPGASCHVFKGGKKHGSNIVVQPFQGFADCVEIVFGIKSKLGS
jgi:hypothetical protein